MQGINNGMLKNLSHQPVDEMMLKQTAINVIRFRAEIDNSYFDQCYKYIFMSYPISAWMDEKCSIVDYQ